MVVVSRTVEAAVGEGGATDDDYPRWRKNDPRLRGGELRQSALASPSSKARRHGKEPIGEEGDRAGYERKCGGASSSSEVGVRSPIYVPVERYVRRA